ncbi:hypothetical protein COV04_01490 [Candidatus Uhrbacteria bacterium CG10_big_fil_rev_8_21_14_0_10_48_11]|uniref:Uncharacterized protein n=1 Tax=Candidatus Uhrbacteria bacterium CG10_big_fil_rev_8_21_14_0_10_48_11 TaxID=1975037 RepID=A0A2M8LEX4_9BACT|nr:MAG: hypothetical protein COV04_01490 [Candidatus Uhrbacteria bacterium CG10_big_fil_rev_8_21_14_0_10_48_11]
MLFNVLPVIIIFLSVAIVVVIVGRRLPEISALDLNEIPEAVSAAGKRALLTRRLEERLRAVLSPQLQRLIPLKERTTEQFAAIYRRLMALEAHYRHAAVSSEIGEAVNQVQPSEIKALLIAAETAAAEGKNVEAERDYLEVIQLEHHNIAAYRGLANVYIGNENYTEARQSIEYALKLSPSDATLYAELAEIATKEGKPEDARRALEQAIVMAPESVPYRIELGDLLIELGETKSAASIFEEAVAIEPNNPRCLDRLVEVCILGGNKRLATSSLRQLKGVNPENQKLAEFAERISSMPRKRSRRSDTIAE